MAETMDFLSEMSIITLILARLVKFTSLQEGITSSDMLISRLRHYGNELSWQFSLLFPDLIFYFCTSALRTAKSSLIKALKIFAKYFNLSNTPVNGFAAATFHLMFTMHDYDDTQRMNWEEGRVVIFFKSKPRKKVSFYQSISIIFLSI